MKCYCSKIAFPVLASTVPEKLFFHFSDSCDSPESNTRNYGEVLEFFYWNLLPLVYTFPHEVGSCT